MNENKDKNIILIDWFAMTYRQQGISPYEVIASLGLPEDVRFQQRAGRYMYRDRLSFGNIHVYYNNVNPDCDFPMVEMTGQGCREFETYSKYSFDYLFELAKDTEHYHIARLDIAYDDHTGIFDIMQIEKDFRSKNWVSSARRGRITVDINTEHNTEGVSVMTGTKSSDIYMRIYDKAIERGYDDGRHWIRCELVLKHDHAVNFISNKKPIGEKFRGAITGYFRFVTPSKTDTNKQRWKMRKYWSDFLDDAEKIKLFTPKDIDYNLHKLHHYVFDMSGNSALTYIKCVGLVRYLDELIQHASKLTPRQKYLIEQSKLLVEAGESVNAETLEALTKKFDDNDSG